jgi:hypothetical protein
VIEFRCWYCNRLHHRPARLVGTKFQCACKYPLRVPARSGGNARVFSLVDFLVTRLVYGGGGAVLGLAVSLIFGARLAARVGFDRGSLVVFLAPPLLGLLIGALFGEAGVGWIGRLFRSDRR